MLEAFCKYVGELRSVPLAKLGIPTSFEIGYKAGEGCHFKTTLPDWDQVAVLLHRLRPLILTSEHASFDRVSGLLGRVLVHPAVRQLLKDNRYIYCGKRFQSKILIMSDNTLLNSEHILMDYLNAFEYHRDQDKAEKLAKLHHILPLESSLPTFLILLSEKVAACFDLADVVNMLLGNTSGLTTQLSKKADQLEGNVLQA
jgi:hypothetical protein